jgi:glycosyltransferase involved in cell wall biosynthesis
VSEVPDEGEGNNEGGRTVLVVPCFNEASRLDQTAFAEFAAADPQTEFVFVDDGSGDETAAVLGRLRERIGAQAHVLSMPTNAGKGEAVRAGMARALETEPEFLGYWDADLSTPLSALHAFRREFEGRPELEIVLGARLKILGRRVERSAIRHWLGRVVATGISLTLDLPVYDSQCGAKLFRAHPGLHELIDEPFITRWLFDVEILARWLRLHPERRRDVGLWIRELPLDEWVDLGDSRVRVTDALRTPLDLVRIYLDDRARRGK